MKKYYIKGNQPGSSTMKVYVTYGECQKNHAEWLGGYALDGCQAFMPSGEEGTPAALTCAACNCLRSFHKLEVHTEIEQNNGPPPQQGARA